tara:strand:- start:901 stop:1131 length:231 start_codon:yes stop_codon:yes gene_type:complete
MRNARVSKGTSRSKREVIRDVVIEHGPLTAREIEELMVDQKIRNAPSTTSIRGLIKGIPDIRAVSAGPPALYGVCE